MNLILTTIAVAAFTISASAASAEPPAIEIWHSDTVWVGQGICSAAFTIDAGMPESPLENLEIAVEAVDRKGNVVGWETLQYPGPIGDSNATRYDVTYLESEDVCEDDLRIAIRGARAQVNGERVPVLVTPRVFKPFEIIAASKR